MALVLFKGGYMDGKSLSVSDGMVEFSVVEDVWNKDMTQMRQRIHRYDLVKKNKNERIGIYRGYADDPLYSINTISVSRYFPGGIN